MTISDDLAIGCEDCGAEEGEPCRSYICTAQQTETCDNCEAKIKHADATISVGKHGTCTLCPRCENFMRNE